MVGIIGNIVNTGNIMNTRNVGNFRNTGNVGNTRDDGNMSYRSNNNNKSSIVLISINNLTKSYAKNLAVDNISLDIFKDEIFGFAGPNGAGKSTLISLLTTLIKPDKGDIIINGYSVFTEAFQIRKMIGFVPQDIALYPTLTGYDNLKFWGGLYGLRGRELSARIDEALAVVAMKDRAHDKVEEYSGGMKRRINIAAALLHHPDILLMDEPTVGVDIISRHYIIDAIKNLKREGRTIIYTSHDIEEMEMVCDRVAIMNYGRILKCDTVEKLKRDGKNHTLKDTVLNVVLSEEH
ncbi:MAG TPA: ABC transporter ATP-binding protein [Clostridiales bacterium]|nr:ABC transporter ATP-binding protein [Clostridiales bacterium]